MYNEGRFSDHKFGSRLFVPLKGDQIRLDTKDLDWNSDTLKVELQNLINDFYARDISRKIHATFAVKRANNTLSRPSIPYGYRWNEDHSNIVPDEETADVVRMIFNLRLEGYGQTAIANKLNEDGIKTHYAMKGRDDKKWCRLLKFW